MATIVPSERTALLNEGNFSNLERAVSNTSHRSRYQIPAGQETGIKDDQEDLDTTYKHEAKLLARYSAPLLITYMLQYTYNLITVLVAGRLGTRELGAASLASMTANITGLCVFEGLAMALDTLTSQAYGAGKRKLVGLHVQRMCAMMVIACIPIGAIWLASPWIIERVVPEKETAQMAGMFLQIYFIGAPGYGVFEALKRFTQAQGNFNASMVVLLICAPLHILWNWLFVFRFGLGFAGAALAIAVSNTLQPIMFVVYINTFARSTLECWPGFKFKRSFQNWGPMAKLGLPSIVMIISEWLAFEILTFASSWLGSEVLAAESVLMTVAVTVYHIPMPVSIAAATRFGNLIGYGALASARKACILYYIVFVCIGLLDIILLVTLRHTIAYGFSDDDSVRAIIAAVIPVVAAAQMFDSVNACSNCILRGLGRQKIGGWVNLSVYYTWAVPLGLWLSFGSPHLGLLGLWGGPLSGLGLVFAIVTIYIVRTDWKKAVEEARARDE